MITLLLSAILIIPAAPVGDILGLKRELRRLGLSSALVFGSQAVDEHPVWSPDGRDLGVNVEGKWSKLDLASLSLRKGTWHDGEAIAVAALPGRLTAMTESEVRSWQKPARFDPRRVTTKDGTTVELEQVDLSTVFRITRNGEKPLVVWKTSLENCHSLSLSPDETLVAYICELNGVIVTTLQQ
jgi:hypothetical protein